MRSADIGIVGGGVVGVCVALACARRGADVVLWEAEPELGLAASGTNSGILHTGFDSKPGELETALILRSAALRPALVETLGIPVLHAGARLAARDAQERTAVAALADNAARNGVEAVADSGGLRVPGEWVTDPVAYVAAVGAAAAEHGARLELGTRVEALAPGVGGAVEIGTDGGAVRCRAVVNCAGLHADAVAGLAGDHRWRIHPRKGEFLVFDPPAPLPEILLPVPSGHTKGVLVFPTLDGRVVAGPTAVDLTDKRDWTVRPEAHDEVRAKARDLYPTLDDCAPAGAYAGLRPAGDDDVNYLIEFSAALPGLLHVAAIRSTGLSASLGIAEYVVERLGLALGEPEPLRAGEPPDPAGPWWRRSAAHWAA